MQSPNFKTFKEPSNLFQGIYSANLCSLAGRYNNHIPTRFLATTDCLKIPAQKRDLDIVLQRLETRSLKVVTNEKGCRRSRNHYMSVGEVVLDVFLSF